MHRSPLMKVECDSESKWIIEVVLQRLGVLELRWLSATVNRISQTADSALSVMSREY